MQLTDAEFEQHFVTGLPGEAEALAESEVRPRQVHGASYSRVRPTPVARPRLLGWSQDCADLLGLAPPQDNDAVAAVLAGNRLLPGMVPFAACYGGH